MQFQMQKHKAIGQILVYIWEGTGQSLGDKL